MTNEEIIDFAKQAGMKASIGKTIDNKYHPDKNAIASSVPIEWLERFVSLVSSHEREQCALMCDEISNQAGKKWKNTYDPTYQGEEEGADRCSVAIRERSLTK